MKIVTTVRARGLLLFVVIILSFLLFFKLPSFLKNDLTSKSDYTTNIAQNMPKTLNIDHEKTVEFGISKLSQQTTFEKNPNLPSKSIDSISVPNSSSSGKEMNSASKHLSTHHDMKDAPDPPNILFLLADDLGYGDLDYNGGNALTPNLDALAAGPHSIKLTRHYSGGPVCSPTRGTLLTGRNHNRYGIWHANSGNKCADFTCPQVMPLPTSEVTVGHILKEQGYRTAIFGKWHLGDLKPLENGHKYWPVSRPDQHGFDEWWVTERSAPTTGLNCACFDKSQCPRSHYNSPPPCKNYYTAVNKSAALEELAYPTKGDDSHFLLELFNMFLENVSRSQEPFFVYIPFHTVHDPYITNEKYRIHYKYVANKYSDDQIDYYGAISAMDEVVGKLRELLKQHDLYENTILWFTSDNGPQEGTPGSTAGFRGAKSTIYEGGIRVPGIIEWPEVIKSNRESDYPVVTSDFLPTVCDLLGVSPPTDRPIDGTSIVPLLRDEKTTRNKTISWAYLINDGNFKGSYNVAITGDQYKMFASYNDGKVQSAKLYDLINDPFEKKDVSSKHPDIFHSLKEEVEEWRQSVYQSATKVGCIKTFKRIECPC